MSDGEHSDSPEADLAPEGRPDRARPGLREAGVRQVVAFVDKRDVQLLGASIGEAVAEIEIGGMANGFAASRAGVERTPANLQRNRDFYGVEIPDKGVDGPLRASQEFRRRLDVRPLRPRATSVARRRPAMMVKTRVAGISCGRNGLAAVGLNLRAIDFIGVFETSDNDNS